MLAISLSLVNFRGALWLRRGPLGFTAFWLRSVHYVHDASLYSSLLACLLPSLPSLW